MSSMFVLALIASGTSVFAADEPVTDSKMVQQTNQVKMKSVKSDGVMDMKDKNGKDIEMKDDTAKKVTAVKHKKSAKTHKMKTTIPVVKQAL